MCGIAGKIRRDQTIEAADRQGMVRALRGMRRRGPDGEGQWASGGVLLGHTRLSIIDLSPSGAQPMVDGETGLVITFNGEIYNYRELRRRFESSGYRFSTQTDTEAILAAYLHYGAQCVDHLNGMFAFCLYDPGKRQVFLARDRLGKKPLYYYRDQHQLVFCSDIRGFHAFADIPVEVDSASLTAFLTLQYIPGVHTIYRSIEQIAPGHSMLLDMDAWTVRPRCYWSIDRVICQPIQEPQIQDMNRLLADSTCLRLIADVEVGLLLSGGVDSSLLAWHITRQDHPRRAFAAGFERADLNETQLAQRTADQLKLDLVHVPTQGITPDVFDNVVFHAGEPFGDPAAVPTYLLAQALKPYVSVVLSGEGADELFLGYNHYFSEKRFLRFAWLRAFLAGSRLGARAEQNPSVPPAAVRLIKILTDQYDLGVARWTTVFSPQLASALVPPDSTTGEYLHDISARFADLSQRVGRLRASLSLDLTYWLPNDLLVKVDRMTMAHGVEARAPFLDYRLVEMALAVPTRWNTAGRTNKRILRQLVSENIPDPLGPEIAARPKHGFETPTAEWLTGPLHDLAEDLLSNSGLASSGLIDPRVGAAVWQAFKKVGIHSPLRRKAWLLLCFQAWYLWHRRGFGLRP
jgi:asparagine synthase (glutamine-hydrolysing)